MTRNTPGWGVLQVGAFMAPRRLPVPVTPPQMAACEHCGEPVECYASTTYHTLGPANTLTGQSGREQYWCEQCRKLRAVVHA